MGTLTVRIDEALERGLERLAARTRRTKSEVVRELLRRHLLVVDLRCLRRRLRPYAEAAGCRTDKDFFREIS